MSSVPGGPRGIPLAHPAQSRAWRWRRGATRAWHLSVAPLLAARHLALGRVGACKVTRRWPRGIPLAHSAQSGAGRWRRAATRAWHLSLAPRLTLRNLALGLVATGLVTCLLPLALIGYGMWQEDQLTQRWSQTVAEPPPSATALSDLPATPSPVAATPVPQAQAAPRSAIPALFAIRVPRIGYYAAVRQGVSTDILATGPGHYPPTGLPGGPGLVGVAAHNTFWIPFGQLSAGDTVILETAAARYTYRVTGTRIVSPDDPSVLVRSSTPRLVLTTCWPLWAGNLATQRLVIYADLSA